jgi:hypothetical protein
METLEEIIGQYDRAEYDADCRRIAELIKSGVPIKFTKYAPGSEKTIQTEIKTKVVGRIKPAPIENNLKHILQLRSPHLYIRKRKHRLSSP